MNFPLLSDPDVRVPAPPQMTSPSPRTQPPQTDPGNRVPLSRTHPCPSTQPPHPKDPGTPPGNPLKGPRYPGHQYPKDPSVRLCTPPNNPPSSKRTQALGCPAHITQPRPRVCPSNGTTRSPQKHPGVQVPLKVPALPPRDSASPANNPTPHTRTRGSRCTPLMIPPQPPQLPPLTSVERGLEGGSLGVSPSAPQAHPIVSRRL